MEWQPIETAPADYPDGDPETLLVWVSNGAGGKGIVDMGWVYIGKRTDERHARAAHHNGHGWDITHWMPLRPPTK